ncbi:apolipoprotein D-like [Microplitis demolitor]|uniref:apolipoprotein D-like n=1 Tax=Microplitis demolitor TaxID=69319 RepID=UPI0004CDD7F1|nr:apolipoprotein D-like [Microplitis demolitor]
MLRLSIIGCLIAGVFTQSFNARQCPHIPVEPVDPNRMVGEWWEYQRSSNNWDNVESCAKMYWNKVENGVLKVVFTDISSLINDNSTVASEIAMENNALYVTVHLPILGPIKKKHYVLETDYDNYAIMWACEYQGSQYTTFAWVKTRDRFPKFDIDRIVRRAFLKRGLPLVPMTTINQDNCPERICYLSN